ncbi:UDP-N-acetylmuramoyl-L-alanyl-D-glutamate--2,6-diaminopimelate ligase [Wenzhouxiangella sediminis]|uniref:UDP-N-acetylmuramoyl-L-alanyl-D-glutamate--2,6-diaminopimelate ligase n=1 Tax=Wenzhouxiangella sediminis TaxID=1792836 RepID=A0A3E1K6Q5_9GAMM|nr:UDP-N-acetylmuramoyl-L-alanyl-D-glutamate--2,6-diaminopimelate ligase [Wenzhouxiangella sediminis]RFF29710.1 UDP-N-acetylmuramoyl-L-alanyl-D-glutamate--2,6-diaminopimelate ligase [Wenzhouxiangella sediminis]
MTERGLTMQALFDGMVELSAGDWPQATGLSLDSRLVRPGDVFVALSGANGHGMRFVYQARDRGAVAVVHDGRLTPPEDLGLPELAVPDIADRLPTLARRFWGEAVDGLDLVAVTGTNGKSSIAWLLAQALGGAMVGTLGWGRPGHHQSGSLTTPDIFSVYRHLADLAGQGVGSVVLEASSHALEQGRLAGLAFSSTIFTTLGHDHLDYHDDRAAYGAAKARLFTEFRSDRHLINLDDDFGAELAARLSASGRLVGYSLAGHPKAGARATLLGADMSGLRAEFELPCGRFEARSKLIGRINLWNLLIVAAELAERGRDPQSITETLAALQPVPGRMEPIGREGAPLAIIDYAHTPDALENALTSARELSDGTLWCVFGCGGDRDREKRPRMGRVAERLADRIVLTDDNPRGEDGLAIIRAIQAGMEKPQRSIVIRDRARAIAHALSGGEPGDIVLVAGKGHETDQVIGDERLPCDDHVSVREALGVAA